MGPEVGVGVRWVSGLGGEEQTGELAAATVSVHEGQGVLHVVLDHGSHGGEALLAVPALPAQGIVAPTIQPPDGNVEDPAVEQHCQGEGLGATRPRAGAHGVGPVLLASEQGTLDSVTVTVL